MRLARQFIDRGRRLYICLRPGRPLDYLKLARRAVRLFEAGPEGRQIDSSGRQPGVGQLSEQEPWQGRKKRKWLASFARSGLSFIVSQISGLRPELSIQRPFRPTCQMMYGTHSYRLSLLFAPQLEPFRRWLTETLAAFLRSSYNAFMDETETPLLERLRAIYSETTIEHILHPHNTDSIPNPDGYASFNTGDGEIIKIWLRIRNDRVEEAAFWTNGCAATIACASISTDLVKEMPASQALAITGQAIADALVDLPPGNFHCAELAAGAVRAAVRDYLSIQQQPWKKLYRK